jgi:peptide/nickel transport system substrate-binding protein
MRASTLPGPVSKAPINGIYENANNLVVSLNSPYAILPSILAHSSAMISAPESFDKEGKSVSAIGTGPFKVTEFSPPQSIIVSRFDGYWGDAPQIDGAAYLAAKRAETRALMAESGDADLVFTLDPSGFKRLGEIESVQTQSAAIPRVMLLKINAAHPMLSDLSARRALSMAIDRQGIAAGIMRFPQSAATQLYPPALDQWHNESLPSLAYDPDTAKSLLADQGWVPGNDGILMREDERFSLVLRTFPDRPELPLVGAALQDQWAQIGVELEVSVSNYSEIPAGHQDGSLDVALYARNYGVTADPTGTAKADFGAGGGDWGAMNWDAPVVAEAIDIIASTSDTAIRNPLIQTVVSEIHTQLPIIPVVWYQHTVSIAKGLEGVEIDPLERTYGLQGISWAE